MTIGAEVNLTENEKMILWASRHNEFDDATSNGVPWTWAVIDNSGLTASVARGVISSLIKKGIICIEGEGDDSTFVIRDEAQVLASENPDPEYATHTTATLEIDDYQRIFGHLQSDTPV